MYQDFHWRVMISTDGTMHQMAQVQVTPQVHQYQLVQPQPCMHSGGALLAQVVLQVLERAEFNQRH
jgi:hypothetical protein